jgi:uncharacterized membrane protein YiaA
VANSLDAVWSVATLLAGTVVLRPYVVGLWIGELLIAGAGIVVHMAVCLLLYNVSRVTLGRWSVERLSATS